MQEKEDGCCEGKVQKSIGSSFYKKKGKNPVKEEEGDLVFPKRL